MALMRQQQRCIHLSLSPLSGVYEVYMLSKHHRYRFQMEKAY